MFLGFSEKHQGYAGTSSLQHHFSLHRPRREACSAVEQILPSQATLESSNAPRVTLSNLELVFISSQIDITLGGLCRCPSLLLQPGPRPERMLWGRGALAANGGGMQEMSNTE